MSKTIFSKIIEGEIPSYKIYETPHVFAFLDIHPQMPGHTLVVPKVAIDAIDDLVEPFYSEIFQVVQKIAKAQKIAFGTKRSTIHVLGFDVPHAHVHVIPANSMSDVLWSEHPQASPEELTRTQQLLLTHL